MAASLNPVTTATFSLNNPTPPVPSASNFSEFHAPCHSFVPLDATDIIPPTFTGYKPNKNAASQIEISTGTKQHLSTRASAGGRLLWRTRSSQRGKDYAHVKEQCDHTVSWYKGLTGSDLRCLVSTSSFRQARARSPQQPKLLVRLYFFLPHNSFCSSSNPSSTGATSSDAP